LIALAVKKPPPKYRKKDISKLSKCGPQRELVAQACRAGPGAGSAYCYARVSCGAGGGGRNVNSGICAAFHTVVVDITNAGFDSSQPVFVCIARVANGEVEVPIPTCRCSSP